MAEKNDSSKNGLLSLCFLISCILSIFKYLALFPIITALTYGQIWAIFGVPLAIFIVIIILVAILSFLGVIFSNWK